MTEPLPPLEVSDLYKKLHATAIEFIRSQDQDPSKPERMSLNRMRAIRTTHNFRHSWGHNYLVSQKPPLQGTHDVDSFLKHLGHMTPLLDSWETKITDVLVDEAKSKVIVRASYYMKARGAEEIVENDIVWFLEMDASAERVREAKEFVDGAASQRLGELMRKGKKEGA